MKKYLITLILIIGMQIGKAQSKENAVADSIYDSVETNASFPGGMDSLYSYIGKKIIYPASARENKKGGKVFVRFIIEKDGSLSSFTVLRTPSKDLGKAVIDLLKGMPKWNPGEIDHKPVRQSYVIPVNYNYQ